MQAILRSIHPQHCANITIGLKTNEVRTKVPKFGAPYKVYIYCTLKGANELVSHIGLDRYCSEKWQLKKGMVIGEYICDKTVCYGWNYDNHGHYDVPDEEVATTCLNMLDLIDYGGGGPLWFEHISNLVVYDEPVPLSDFVYTSILKTNHDNSTPYKVTSPPQSYCIVKDRGDFYART